jgi:hypothetical protein
MRGTRWGLLVLTSILVVMMVMTTEAFGSPFVEGESLEWCGGGGGGLTLSGDGQTAISGECVFVRSEGKWMKQGLLPLPAFKHEDLHLQGVRYLISSDGNTVYAQGEWATPGNPVFVRAGEVWTQQATFPQFRSVILSGDGNTIADSHEENKQKVVTIYVRSGEAWVQQATLAHTTVQRGKKGEEEAQFFIGMTLSYDGNTLLTTDIGANKGKGADFVYARSGETWTEQATIAPAGIKGKNSFGGGRLSADGNTAVISEGRAPKKGAVYFFTRSGQAWTQQGPKIVPPKLKSWSVFGQNLALSGDGSTALILSGNRFHGRPEIAWVYERSGETWTNTQQILPPSTPESIVDEIFLSEDGKTAMFDVITGTPPGQGPSETVEHQTLSWTR